MNLNFCCDLNNSFSGSQKRRIRRSSCLQSLFSNFTSSLVLNILVFYFLILGGGFFTTTKNNNNNNNNNFVEASRVIEFGEKFADLYIHDQRAFLVKFYAPWCHHCKELEPIWSQVAQRLHNESPHTPLVVGRIDCTRYVSTASHFGIRGFPTILLIAGDRKVEYRGERTTDEIIDFALRVTGPAMKHLPSCAHLEPLVTKHRVVFIHFGSNQLDREYAELAEQNQAVDWFYRSAVKCNNYEQGVHVIKASSGKSLVFKFDPEKHGSMSEWIKRHRFPHFGRFSASTLHMAFHSSYQYTVVVVVEEYRQTRRLTERKHNEANELIERLAHDYTNQMVFGWCSDLTTLNSMAIRSIKPLPNLLVFNGTNYEYFLLTDQFEEDRVEINETNVRKFLDDILERPETLVYRGGNLWYRRMYRGLFDSVVTLVTMYQGNPFLTLTIFGLPLTFLSFIVYLTCFADIWDAREDDENEEENEEIDEEEGRMKRLTRRRRRGKIVQKQSLSLKIDFT